ncbi:hypothetical protein KJ780_00350 [Candidatus Micrarchaeota archaeon]|nr:hypothetical protein [Candidatus Micrarchaeota archaeon]
MINPKRILVASFFGLVAGIICYSGGLFMGLANNFGALAILNLLANRMLIGFVIGISALRMKWFTHGLVIGSIVGIPYFLSAVITGYEPMLLISVLFLNAFFGLMIEFFTSKVFKLPLGE